RPQAALSALVDELDWLLSFLAPPEQRPGLDLCREQNAEGLEAVVSVLRAAADQLDGGDERPDLQRLQVARRELVVALARQIPDLPETPDDPELMAAVEPTFRVRAL